MGASIQVYLNSCPSIDEMRLALGALDLSYKHSLPPDERASYPMHIFGCGDLRLVYHAGDPHRGEAVVDATVLTPSVSAQVRLRLVLAALVRRFGGAIHEDEDRYEDEAYTPYRPAFGYSEISA